MQCNATYKLIGHCLTSLRIQTQKLFYFEGIKEGWHLIICEAANFQYLGNYSHLIFATYLLKQYTKPPATKARSDPEAISHYDKKVTVKKSSQNFIFFFFFLLFS